MTTYELPRLLFEPFLPTILWRVRHDLEALLRASLVWRAQVLDIGGRKSQYTIGLDADVTVLDIPRETEQQQALNLGMTDAILADLRKKRSNIESVVLQDMVRCTLPTGSFDGVICVEVIEHVGEDEAFMVQAARVLKQNGWLYLTTPDGDYIRNEPPHHNSDHVRHYSRRELEELLARCFDHVKVVYGVKTGKYRNRGLRSIDPRHPLATLGTMFSNVASHVESRGLDEQPRRTAHLIACAMKSL